ncbi:hypothetical protein ACKGJI_05665 [Sulfurospirillum sp. 1307]|jgi:hypothetical protein
MKKVFFIMFLSTLLFSNDLTNKVIKFNNYEFKKSMVLLDYDPFVRGSKVIKSTLEAKKEDKTFYVSSILNHKAFINSKWYKTGDKVLGYKIIAITKENVLVRKDSKTIKIGIKRDKKLLEVKEK